MTVDAAAFSKGLAHELTILGDKIKKIDYKNISPAVNGVLAFAAIFVVAKGYQLINDAQSAAANLVEPPSQSSPMPSDMQNAAAQLAKPIDRQSVCPPSTVIIIDSGIPVYDDSDVASRKKVEPIGGLVTLAVVGEVEGKQTKLFAQAAGGLNTNGGVFVDLTEKIAKECSDYSDRLGTPKAIDYTVSKARPGNVNVIFRNGDKSQPPIIARINKVADDEVEIQYVQNGKVVTEHVKANEVFVGLASKSESTNNKPALAEISNLTRMLDAINEPQPYDSVPVTSASKILPNRTIENAILQLTVHHQGIKDVSAIASTVRNGDIVLLGSDHYYGPAMEAIRGGVMALAQRNKIVLLTGLFDQTEQLALDKYTAKATSDDKTALAELVGPGTLFNKHWGASNYLPSSNFELYRLLDWTRKNKVKLIATGGDVFKAPNSMTDPAGFVAGLNIAENQTAKIIAQAKATYKNETVVYVGGGGHLPRNGKYDLGIPTFLEPIIQKGNPGVKVHTVASVVPFYDGANWIPFRDALSAGGIQKATLAVYKPKWGSAYAAYDESGDGHGIGGLDWLIFPYNAGFYTKLNQ